MNILYFAWLREILGFNQEYVDPPKDINTVIKLINWLKLKSDKHAKAFEDITIIRVAVNMETVELEHPVKANDEVAIFPPMTGGKI
tara:strand:+ start:658 stop:915 length:258 start_codon:yes stop_codon:yes gene_type:complete